MIKLKILIILITLAITNTCVSATAIFYQPQIVDMKISDERWPAIFHSVKAKGFDTLVVQWTRYGNLFAVDEQRIWLKARMDNAIEAGLQLIIGLNADPDVFTRLEQPTSLLTDYFRKLTQNDIALAKSWLEVLPVEKISGWYLPLEIDDRRWRDLQAFETLRAHIHEEVNVFKKISTAPVTISTFFTGNMAPQKYANMLIDLKKKSALKIWVQDGKGTLALNDGQRNIYMNLLTKCNDPVIDGVVHELFKQVSADSSFKAVPLTQSALQAALKQRAPCNGENVFFELRYIWDY